MNSIYLQFGDLNIGDWFYGPFGGNKIFEKKTEDKAITIFNDDGSLKNERQRYDSKVTFNPTKPIYKIDKSSLKITFDSTIPKFSLE